MEAWIAGFQDANPDASVAYDPVGSGGGREQFIAGGAAVRRHRLGARRRRAHRRGEALRRRGQPDPDPGLHLADRGHLQPRRRRQAAAVARDGRADLRAEDQELERPGDQGRQPRTPTCPSTRITPVNRSDESGTTENFTDYLAEDGARATGRSRSSGNWPVKGGEAAEGTSGVVEAVKSGKGTIGYADESQAGDLGIAAIKVGDKYVEPTPEAAAKVLDDSKEDRRARASTSSPTTSTAPRRRRHVPAGARVLPDRPAPSTTTPTRASSSRRCSATSSAPRARRRRQERRLGSDLRLSCAQQIQPAVDAIG